MRTDEQTAIFGELTADITEQLAITVGARYYDVEVELVGSAAGSFGNLGAAVDNNGGNNLDTLFSGANPDTASTDGYIGKVSLAWTPNSNTLIYATWSEGFRPGLLNRPGGRTNPAGTFTVPFALETDDVVNMELGWKLIFSIGPCASMVVPLPWTLRNFKPPSSIPRSQTILLR